MEFKLSRTKSAAKLVTEFLPRFAATDDEVQQGVPPDAPVYTLSRTTSAAVTPEYLRSQGRLLLGVGDAGGFHAPVRSLPDGRRIGEFRERGKMLYRTVTERGELREYWVSNFTLKLIARLRVVGLKGSTDFMAGVACTESGDVTFEIESDRYISHLLSELKARNPQLRDNAEFRNVERVMREYFSVVLQASLHSLPWRTIYSCAGWQGDRVYHHCGMGDCRSERHLADISLEHPASLFALGYGILLIGDLSASLPIYLQLHVGYAAKLFEDGGSQFQHIMAWVGPTGSRKTSVAKVAFCQFENQEMINFTATDRAFDLHAERCHDATMVLDDLSSAKSKTMTEKLNRFLRQHGDGTGYAKTVNSGKDIERTDTRRGVVMTAESSMENLQQSGRLRIVEVPISVDTVNNDALHQFQLDLKMAQFEHRPSAIERYISGFVHFLERNYATIVAMIATMEPPPISLRFPRQQATYRNFYHLAQIVMQFGIESGAFSSEAANKILAEEWLPVIQRLMWHNERLCAQDDPYKLFLHAVAYGLAQHMIAVAQSREEFQRRATDLMGYWEKDILKLDPHRAYSFATSMYHGRGFSATENDIWAVLCDKGICQGYAQKNHKAKPLRQVKINGIKVNMLCLIWREVEKILRQEELQ